MTSFPESEAHQQYWSEVSSYPLFCRAVYVVYFSSLLVFARQNLNPEFISHFAFSTPVGAVFN